MLIFNTYPMKIMQFPVSNFFKKTVILSVFTFIIVACNNYGEIGNVLVEGTITGGEGQKVRLSEMTTEAIIHFDSATVNNGNFRLSANIAETSFFLLQLDEGLPITLILSPGETVKLIIDKTQQQIHYEIDGNFDSEILKDYYNKAGEARKQLDSLQEILFDSRILPDFSVIKNSIDATLESMLTQHNQFTRTLIETNPSSLAAILLINKSFAGRQLFVPAENLDLFQLTDEHLMAKYPENSHVVLHHRRVMVALETKMRETKAEDRISPGQSVPSIKLFNPEGNQIALQDLKPKTVVLFFWTSWSPESRADVQLLKNLYQKMEAQDFEIFAVSLDHREHYWKAALDLENTSWINVNEPSGLGGSLARLFNLPPKLPYYFVIDSRGIIQLKTDNFSEMKSFLMKLTE
jgi:thiol-disulfide isomerase/thioredoxin